MARYFFHMRTGSDRVEDQEGSDLPDLDVAISEAEEGAYELIAECVLCRQTIEPDVIEVADESGLVHAEVRLHDLVTALLRSSD